MDVAVVQGISPASSLVLVLQGPGLEPSTDYENSSSVKDAEYRFT